MRRLFQIRSTLPLFGCALACLFLGWPPSAFASAPLNYMTGSGDKADAVVPLTWGVTIISVAVIVRSPVVVASAGPLLVWVTLGPCLGSVDEPFGGSAAGEWPFLLACPAVSGQLGATFVAAAVERVPVTR